MTIDDLGIIDRPAAFPIYSFTSDALKAENHVPRDYEPGRVVDSGHREPVTCRIDPTLEERLGPNDIVFVPLYLGQDTGPNHNVCSPCDNTSFKAPAYDENMEFIRRVAPHVKAILVGNGGAELSFKHLWLREPFKPRMMMIDEMIRFVDETSGFIREAGGTPCYGPVDWDVAVDCYYGDGRYRDHCNSVGALQVVYCGFQLFSLGLDRLPTYAGVPHESDSYFWRTCPHREDPPWPVLSEYLAGYDHIMSGVEFLTGLRRGNDIVLAEHGFGYGLCGGLTVPSPPTP